MRPLLQSVFLCWKPNSATGSLEWRCPAVLAAVQLDSTLLKGGTMDHPRLLEAVSPHHLGLAVETVLAMCSTCQSDDQQSAEDHHAGEASHAPQSCCIHPHRGMTVCLGKARRGVGCRRWGGEGERDHCFLLESGRGQNNLDMQQPLPGRAGL